MIHLCDKSSGNKTASGYCATTACINPQYSNIGTVQYGQGVQKRIVTNYDRLVSKSPEELTEWIESIEPAACPWRDDHGDNCRFTHCRDCWLDWLKQEVSSDID